MSEVPVSTSNSRPRGHCGTSTASSWLVLLGGLATSASAAFPSGRSLGGARYTASMVSRRGGAQGSQRERPRGRAREVSRTAVCGKPACTVGGGGAGRTSMQGYSGTAYRKGRQQLRPCQRTARPGPTLQLSSWRDPIGKAGPICHLQNSIRRCYRPRACQGPVLPEIHIGVLEHA